MKKFSKILALALAVAMMLGMTTMAATLYYKQDFNYTDATGMQGDAYNINSNGFFYGRDSSFSYDVATYKASGKNMVVCHGGFFNAKNVVKVNKFGNNSFGVIANDKGMGFFPTNSWDATAANQTETYVISLDVDTSNLAKFNEYYYFATVIGNRGTAETPAYNGARLMTTSASEKADSYGLLTPIAIDPDDPNHKRALGNVLFNTVNDTKRVAFSFKSASGGLTRDSFVDGEAIATGTTFELENMSTIEGITFNFKSDNYTPYIGKLRMYTIDTTEDLVATADINGETGILPSTNKVTIKFNQPVGAANVAVKANGAAVEGVTTTVRDVVSSDGSFVSEVDLIFADGVGYGKNYSIDLSGVKNDLGDACISNAVTFSTMAVSTDVKVYEGLAEGKAIEVANAAGKTVYVKATVANSNSVALSGKVIIGIYDASGNLVKYASATKALAANGNAEFAAAFKLAAGQSIVAEYK